jgi:hypothetical protein
VGGASAAGKEGDLAGGGGRKLLFAMSCLAREAARASSWSATGARREEVGRVVVRGDGRPARGGCRRRGLEWER